MKRIILLLSGAALACVAVPILVGVIPTYWGNVLFYFLLYACLGQAWNITGGYARQVSLGQSAFVGAAAYTYSLLVLQAGFSALAAAACGVLAGGLLAAFLGGLVAAGRLRGVYFTLSTLAFCEILRRLVSNSPSLGGAVGLSLPGASGRAWFDALPARCAVLAGVLTLATGGLVRLHSATFGLRLRLIGVREVVAEASGVPVVTTLWTASILSGLLSAFAGVLFCQHLGYAHPDLMFGTPLSVQCAVIAVLGGRGTPGGPLLGAAILVPLGEVARMLVVTGHGGVQLLLSGTVMVVVVALFPGGVWEAFCSPPRDRDVG